MSLRSAWSPPPVDRIPLAACAAAVAGVALVLQLAMPAPAELPSPLAARRKERPAPAPPHLVAVALDPVVLARHPFGGANGALEPTTGANGGLTLVGLVDAAGRASALIRDPSGATQSLRIGQALGAWRLIGVVDGRAVLAGPAGPVTLEVGASSGQPPPAPPSTIETAASR